MTYSAERRLWSDAHMEQVVRILGNLPIKVLGLEFSVASAAEDMHEATDLKLLRVGQKAIAVRIRKTMSWLTEVTFRAYSGGFKTEIHKILEGYADLFFYGYSPTGKAIEAYHVLDLEKFRKYWDVDLFGHAEPKYPISTHMNHDGYTGFVAVPLSVWPSDIVVASSVLQIDVDR